MLKLPKIQEQGSHLKIEFKEIVMSKLNIKSIKNNTKDSKFDWIGCQIKLVQNIENEIVLQNLNQFQTTCKDKKIDPFYSYFFLKSLLLNKNLSQLAQNKQQSQFKDSQNQSLKQSKLFTQNKQKNLVQFIITNCKDEQKKIKAQSSLYHKIQNFIFLRQDIIKDIQQKYKSQSHNSLHQNINDMRFLNLQIFQLIKKWKGEMIKLQDSFIQKNYQENGESNYQNLQPIFYYQDQNYLSKVIYDNANMINFMNSKKNTNFISPPNPFFLSQDGNKQSMSQKQKQKIQQAMDFLAKQKAYQLKLLIDPPEYLVKNKINERIKSTMKHKQKGRQQSNQQRHRKVKNPFQRLNKAVHQTELQKISPYKTNIPFQRYSSTNNNSRQKILSAYKTKTSKLRQSVQRTNQNRGKFDQLIKSKEVQVLKQIRKKKSPPKQFPTINNSKQISQSKINYISQSKINQSPYKQKLSNLRRQVQKNLLPVTKKQAIKQQASIVNNSRLQNSIPYTKDQFLSTSRVQVKTTKPKMKLIVQRQVAVQQKTNNPVIQLLAKKTLTKQQIKKNQQEQLRKSRSTFFKQPQPQKSRSKIKLIPMNNSKDEVTSMIASKISFHKKRGISDVKHFSTTSKSGFLYKPSSLQKQLKDYLKPKKNSIAQKAENYQSLNVDNRKQQNKIQSRKPRTIFDNRSQIDNKRQDAKIQSKKSKIIFQNHSQIDASLSNLKNKIRQAQIKRIYGKKMSSPNKKLYDSQLIVKQQKSQSHYDIEKSPYKKGNDKDSDNKSTFLKKEARALQMKIQKLLKKQNQHLQHSLSKSIQQQQNETIFNQFRSINKDGRSQMQSMDQNIQKLHQKKKLIQQSNQIKKKQLQNSKKKKEKNYEEIQIKQQRLKQLEDRISKLKNNRMKQYQEKQSRINQEVASEKLQKQSPSIRKLIEQKVQFQKQSQKIQQQMRKQQQKFIVLKQQQFKLRQQANQRKYLNQLQQMKIKNLQKQKQYEQKILEEQRQRKQNQILLVKQRRQAQQLRLKLQEQQMKQILLKQILQKQKQRQNKIDQQTSVYQEEVRKKIQRQLIQKQEYQKRMIQNFQQDNQRMLKMMQQIRQKNRRIQQTLKKKQQQVQKTIKQKQEQSKLLQKLEKQVQEIQESHNKIKQNQQIKKVLNNIQQKNSHVEPIDENQQDIETLKLRLKEEILKQMIQRRKKQQQQQLKFQQQRKKRIQFLQQQIKQFLKKQDQMVKRVMQGKQVDMSQFDNIGKKENLQFQKQQHKKNNIPQDKIVQQEFKNGKNQKLKTIEQQKNQTKYNLTSNSQKELQMQPIKDSISKQIPVQQKQTQPQQKSISPQKKQHKTPNQDTNLLNIVKNQNNLQNIPTKDITTSKSISPPKQTKLQQKQKELSKQKTSKSNTSPPKDTKQTKELSKEKQIKKSNEQNKQQPLKIQNKTNTQPNLQNKEKNVFVKEEKNSPDRISRMTENIQQSKPDSIKNVQQKAGEKQKANKESLEKSKEESLQKPKQKSPQKQKQKPLQKIEQKPIQKQKQKSLQKSQSLQKPIQKSLQKSILKQTPKPEQKKIQQNFSSPQNDTKRQNQNKAQELSQSTSKAKASTSKLSLKQTTEQILQKYENLKEHLNSKTRLIVIEENQIDQFLIDFYSQFSIEVKQMLPYTKTQLTAILKNHKALNKKIDLFDCRSIGWYDPEAKKYSLLGSIQCVHLIQKKYGQTQIQLVYLFNKSNHYQKQFLAKQIKIFQKIGFIYQKKMKQGEMYSIKLIIKIPKQVVPKGFQLPDETLQFISQLTINNLSNSSQNIAKSNMKNIQKSKNIFWYLLYECIKNNSSKQQLQAYLSNVNYSIDLTLFIDFVKNISQKTKTYLTEFVQNEQTNTSLLQMSFKFPYLQLANQLYFSLNSSQYTLNNGEKVYLSSSNKQAESIWKILVIQMNKDTLLQKSYLETNLHTKIIQINQKLQSPDRKLGILIPVFKTFSKFNLHQSQDFKKKITFKSNIRANLISSSISGSNSLPNQQRKIISLSKKHQNHGFVFCICYCPNKKIDTVVTGTWVGYQDIVKSF